jgi:hypothetical protein
MNRGQSFQVRVYFLLSIIQADDIMIICTVCAQLKRIPDFKKTTCRDPVHTFILGTLVYMVANNTKLKWKDNAVLTIGSQQMHVQR